MGGRATPAVEIEADRREGADLSQEFDTADEEPGTERVEVEFREPESDRGGRAPVVEMGVLPAAVFGPPREGKKIKISLQTTLELRTFVAFLVVVAVATRTPLWEGSSVARSDRIYPSFSYSIVVYVLLGKH